MTLATDYIWLSFDSSTEEITVNALAGLGVSGSYTLRYKCVLDDDDLSEEWTTLTYYLVETSATAQTDIIYLLNQDVKRVAIDTFTYDPSGLPLATSSSATWNYSVTVSSGDANICTVASDSGTDFLVGTTSDASAGSTIGVISSISKSGTHVYTLTGTLSFTDSVGRSYSTSAQSTDVTIEVIHFEIQVQMTNIYYRSGEPAEVVSFTSFV